MDFFPFFCCLFASANFVPDAGMEDLSTAAGEGVQTRVAQGTQGLLERHFKNALCQVADFDRRKGFDMESRIQSTKTS